MFLQFTYDSSQFYFNNQKIQDLIINLRTVTDWWHYIPNVYILETTSNEMQIANEIIREFPGMRFLVTKIDIKTPNGVLPQSAWDWIAKKNSQKRTFIPIKAVQPRDMLMRALMENDIKKNDINTESIRRALELRSNGK